MEWQIDGGQSGCFDEDKSKRVPRSSLPDVFEIFLRAVDRGAFNSKFEQ